MSYRDGAEALLGGFASSLATAFGGVVIVGAIVSFPLAAAITAGSLLTIGATCAAVKWKINKNKEQQAKAKEAEEVETQKKAETEQIIRNMAKRKALAEEAKVNAAQRILKEKELKSYSEMLNKARAVIKGAVKIRSMPIKGALTFKFNTGEDLCPSSKVDYSVEKVIARKSDSLGL